LEPAGDDLSFVARQSRNYCSGQISGRPASLYSKGNVWTNQGAFGRQAEPEFSLEDRARVGAVMASVGRKLGLGAAIIRGIRGVGADGRQISQPKGPRSERETVINFNEEDTRPITTEIRRSRLDDSKQVFRR